MSAIAGISFWTGGLVQGSLSDGCDELEIGAALHAGLARSGARRGGCGHVGSTVSSDVPRGAFRRSRRGADPIDGRCRRRSLAPAASRSSTCPFSPPSHVLAPVKLSGRPCRPVSPIKTALATLMALLRQAPDPSMTLPCASATSTAAPFPADGKNFFRAARYQRS